VLKTGSKSHILPCSLTYILTIKLGHFVTYENIFWKRKSKHYTYLKVNENNIEITNNNKTKTEQKTSSFKDVKLLKNYKVKSHET